MKKILFFIIVIFCLLLGIYVRANDVIILEVGAGDVSDLQEENCKIITHNVDFNKSGKYDVYYYHQVENRYFHKPVIVNNEFAYVQQQGIVIEEAQLEDDGVVGIEYVKSDEFYVYGNIDSGDEVIQTNFMQTYAYVSYYKNNAHQWTKIFNDRYSYIKDACLVNTNILLGIAYGKNDVDSDILLIEISKKQDVIFSKTFGWNGIEILKEIHIKNNDVYCILESDASNIDPFFSNNIFLLLVKFDYARKEIVKIKTIGNNRTNYLLDSLYDNGFYLLVRASGTSGDIHDQNVYNGSFIVKVNEDLEIVNTKRQGFPNSEALFLDKTMRGLFTTYTINLPRYTVYSSSFYSDLNYNDRREYEGNGSFKKILGNEREENTYLVQGTKAWLLNMQTQEKVEIGNFSISLIHYIDGGYYFISNNNKYCFYDLNFEEETKTTYNYQDYYSGFIFANEEIIGWLQENSSDVFGEYIKKVEMGNNKIKYIINYKYYVPFKCNLRNNEIYDVNTRVFFNGQGYLDGTAIESGQRMLDEGKHELVVLGNNERKVIYFEVMAKAISPKEDESEEVLVNGVDINITNKNKDYMQIEEVSIVDEDKSYGYGIIVIISVLAISLFIPIKKKGEK